jgi:polyphosphate kinase
MTQLKRVEVLEDRRSGLEADAGEPASLFFNRELSWLEFNRRVLAEAADPTVPLFERLKFIAIFDSNLDEFFMKRVGGLKQQVASHVTKLSPDGRTPRQQLAEIDDVVRPMVTEQRRLLHREILPGLEEHRVRLVSWEDLTGVEVRFLREYFESQVFPVLTPLAVDPAHPFPFISNMSVSLAVAVQDDTDDLPRFARVKVPQSLARFVRLPDRRRFIAVEEVIIHHLDQLFPGLEIRGAYPFRVTRNADVRRAEETAEDLLAVIQEELRERRFATVVRFEIEPGMPPWMVGILAEHLDFTPEDTFELEGPLGLRDLFELVESPLQPLQEKPWNPVTHPRLQPDPDLGEVSIFDVIKSGDLLVHHPYDSFGSSVQRFIETAAHDPAVLAIKQTIYRTSSDSPIMKSLIHAADEGKQVAVSVEIKARFDEANNIEWSEQLEEAGAHVSFGHVGLKNHAKIALVVRQEEGAVRKYSHIGTGNYNPETARLYTDVGLLTADPVIAGDVVKLFNLLTSYLHEARFERLLVAPLNMKRRFLELIRAEIEHQKAGRGGHIIAKMNGLEDPEMVEALYEASQAGVEIDLVVRGVCRLRPGLPGKSETIRVVSIVGRFLEHARIFYFHNGGESRYFVGSADWMVRNLHYRIEAVVPVDEPELQRSLKEILDLQLTDNVKAWDLLPDGSYCRRHPCNGEDRRASQEILMEKALERSRKAWGEG